MEFSLESARPALAILGMLALCWVLSENRRRFPWLLAIGALGLQAGLVLLLFAIPQARPVVEGIGDAVNGLSAATQQGTQFVFSYLGNASPAQPYVLSTPNQAPFIFAFQVLPLILVISALSALLWHWGILKLIIRGFGLVFEKSMGLGGASATSAAANIFMGMVESPIVIKAYLEKLSRSEIFLMMVLGLGTVAGSTLVAYVAMLSMPTPDGSPFLPNAAAHILAASIISAPACILLARVMVPEADEKAAAAIDYSATLRYETSMDAISKGIQDGVMVAVNIAATLIVFVALVALVNALLGLAPDVLGAKLTLERIFGWLFAPLAWAIGVPWGEADKAGELLGAKLFLTEFLAFQQLGATDPAEISERTRLIMAYALCGFANVGSVGIMIAGMTQLFPPERRRLILDLAWKSLLPGFLATCMTAAVVACLPASIFAR
jgi:CNT family concentrative nucleoside transporter